MSILAAIIGSIQGTAMPTYTLTPFFSGGPESVNEGSSLNFLVGGTNIPDGTYYWTIETNSGDFATTNGTVSVTGTTGSNLGVIYGPPPTADATTEGAETFTVALRSGSITGTILVTSQSVTINDTSFAPSGSLIINAQTRPWATTNATSSTYGAYTYPDETSGSLHSLTGTQYVLSELWGTTATICFNLWFYPTANDKVIMVELGQTLENSGFHYSMLEINSSNYLKGRTWGQSGAVTSTGTVTLNAWNHVYFYFDNVTSTFSMSLNNESAVTQGSVSKTLSITGYSYWGIGLVESTNMGSSARYQGKFADLVIDTTLIGSNYTSTKAKYLPPLSLSFGGNASPDYLSVPASADWALGTSWTIEWWSKATTRTIDGGAGLWTVMCQNPGNGVDIYYHESKLNINNGTVLATEPVPGQWTHVALVNNAGTMTLYYNGASVYSGGNWNLGNTTDPLVIGRRGSGNYQYFPGFLSMIRISDMAIYTAEFTPTITYSNEVSTVLFLGLTTPLTDTSASARTITNNGVTTSLNVPTTVSPVSLEFNQPQADYLVAPASADWNLGNDWTMEFWIRSNNNSASNINIPGGQWGLINQGGWYYGMPDDNCILVGLAGGYLTINQSATGDISFAEPTTQQWTHVAIVNNGGGSAQKVYYNGVQQTPTGANYTTNGKTNTTEPLYIGRLEPSYGGYFDGKMAMVRISNTAMYLTAFTATTTYGIEASTKLFLGKYAPWTDNTGLRYISNTGVSTSSSFPVPPTYSFTTTPAYYNQYYSSDGSGPTNVFVITTTDVPNSTTLYWTIDHINTVDNDFAAVSGSFVVSSNSGTFTLATTGAFSHVGNTFRIQIRTQSISGPVVSLSNSVTVQGCVAPWTSILLADKTTTTAGELTVGTMLWTQHETTLEWGEYAVTDLTVISDMDRYTVTLHDSRELVASGSHPVLTTSGWKNVMDLVSGDEISREIGTSTVSSLVYRDRGDVIKITVDSAHTYVSEGIISHNK